jgi:hypothetical protein
MGNANSSSKQALALHHEPLNDLNIDVQPESGENVMSAVTYNQHGSVDSFLEISNKVSRPQPSPDQVLVKVHAYAINPLDVKLLETPLKGTQTVEIFMTQN